MSLAWTRTTLALKSQEVSSIADLLTITKQDITDLAYNNEGTITLFTEPI